jgi:hypothetical protein
MRRETFGTSRAILLVSSLILKVTRPWTTAVSAKYWKVHIAPWPITEPSSLTFDWSVISQRLSWIRHWWIHSYSHQPCFEWLTAFSRFSLS